MHTCSVPLIMLSLSVYKFPSIAHCLSCAAVEWRSDPGASQRRHPACRQLHVSSDKRSRNSSPTGNSGSDTWVQSPCQLYPYNFMYQLRREDCRFYAWISFILLFQPILHKTQPIVNTWRYSSTSYFMCEFALSHRATILQDPAIRHRCSSHHCCPVLLLWWR